MTSHRSRWSLLAIVLLAAAIAWIAPFDVLFTAATDHSAPRRAGLIALFAIVGATASGRAGMRLDGHGAGAPLRIGLGWAALVAGWVVALDCFVFRTRLADGYVAFLRSPLAVRLPYFMVRAFNENVIYRLFGFGTLAWLMQALRGGRPLPVPGLVGVMVLVQCVNIGANVVAPASGPITAGMLGYDALRYVAPGALWAWLFYRHGFATAEVASVGCHLFLQPAFSLLLDR